LTRVLGEGAVIAIAGIVAGAAGGIGLAWVVGSYVPGIRLPGVLTIVGAATVLIAAATVASLMPAARASRVDVIQALRSD
jgi:ABC-type antimicrobial peptide transport system permease subunit